VVVAVAMHMEPLIRAQAVVVLLTQPELLIPEAVAEVGPAIILKAATVDLEWSLSSTPIHIMPRPQQAVPLLQQLLDTEFTHLPVLVHLQ
jgi:hypothetical protein